MVRNDPDGGITKEKFRIQKRDLLKKGTFKKNNNLVTLVSLLFPDSNLNLVPVSAVIISDPQVIYYGTKSIVQWRFYKTY